MSKDIKIFCVGGHKNGTFSLHNYFLNHELDSIHGQFWMHKGFDFIDKHTCFSDHFAEKISKIKHKYKTHPIIHLVKRYPNSLFILNYRDLDGYIESICKHLSIGLLAKENWRWKTKIDNIETGSEDIKTVYRRIMDTYISNQFILYYFQKNNLMDRLLVLKITGDKYKNTKLLNDFLKGIITDKPILFENIKHHAHISDKIINEAKKISNIKSNKLKKKLKINNTQYSNKMDKIYNSYFKK